MYLRRGGARRLIGLWAALGCAACGDGSTAPDGSVDGGATLIAVAVDTVAPAQVRAGSPLMVSCVLVDANGETFAPPANLTPQLRFVPEDSVEQATDGTWTATTAGRLEVGCTFSALRLTDDTPANVEVLPGDPASILTRLDRDSITAGESVNATCEVYDAFGNRIADAAPTMRSEPAHEGNAFEGPRGTFERAGRFAVTCELPGAQTRGAALEVLPALPASLVVARVPDQPLYAIGQVIDLARIVTDRFGNAIADARVPVVSTPNGQALGDGRFRYLADGRYTLTATVAPPTEGGVPLSASVEVIVDGNGPAITCDEPFDGAILDLAPGAGIDFRGAVNDISGIRAVRVNGNPVTPDGSGAFAARLTTQYGINFVDVAATDNAGREASRTCAFLVANTWAPDDRTLGDTVAMRLRQAAIDDGARGGGINSLGDVLHTVLNSTALRDTLHNAMLAANPVKPSACDQGGPFGTCLLRSEVLYLDSQINGPNTVSLTLVDGGMRASVNLNNLRVRLRVRGHVAGIGYDTTGWVTFSSIAVQATFDTALTGGRPRLSVRSGSVTTQVGSVSTDFSGLSGAVIDIVVSLAQGRVRDLVAGLVRDWVTNNFNSILDSVISGLDVESLGTSFNVPRLDMQGTIPLSFGVGFSALSTNPSRVIFGLGTRLSTPPAHARPTRGAPVRAGCRLLDAGGAGSTAIAIHEAVLNQALHALWRGGFFDATLGGGVLGGLPAGVGARMSTGLPPVAVVRQDRVELSLGAVGLDLTYPELFTEPIRVSLGARASMSVRLVGEDLVFEDFRIEQLYFSTELVGLDMRTRDTIEGFLRRLLERVVGNALNNALPAIPVPSFELPASLAQFGLPAGARLGLVGPALAAEAPHFVLRGGFAVR